MDQYMKPLTYVHHRYAVHNSGPKCTQILKPEKLKTQNKSLMVKVHIYKMELGSQMQG